jgi:hypothetical protein
MCVSRRWDARSLENAVFWKCVFRVNETLVSECNRQANLSISRIDRWLGSGRLGSGRLPAKPPPIPLPTPRPWGGGQNLPAPLRSDPRAFFWTETPPYEDRRLGGLGSYFTQSEVWDPVHFDLTSISQGIFACVGFPTCPCRNPQPRCRSGTVGKEGCSSFVSAMS